MYTKMSQLAEQQLLNAQAQAAVMGVRKVKKGPPEDEWMTGPEDVDTPFWPDLNTASRWSSYIADCFRHGMPPSTDECLGFIEEMRELGE